MHVIMTSYFDCRKTRAAFFLSCCDILYFLIFAFGVLGVAFQGFCRPKSPVVRVDFKTSTGYKNSENRILLIRTKAMGTPYRMRL